MFRKIRPEHTPKPGALDLLKYIGPGFIVTVGFIDPGNWAANVAAGSAYGYSLLWMVTLSTLMLIVLQHNSAHLGIVTGLCLAEASTKFLPKTAGRLLLTSAVAASISTALAEILGAAIGLRMLTGLPLFPGSALSAVLVVWMVLSKSYRKIERWIIGFVSLIGISFVFELLLVRLDPAAAVRGLFVPSFPADSLPIIVSVLGAVVMPHNLFLHSEIIQSRQWNLGQEEEITGHLRFEFMDTLAAMFTGWGINAAIIIVAASAFHSHGIAVNELPQAEATLRPVAGPASSFIFAVALLFSGFSSAVTAAMAGGSIFAGLFGEPLDFSDSHSRLGMMITLIGGLAVIFFLRNPFLGIIWSQVALSLQLPLTIFALVFLTSSGKVMGKFANRRSSRLLLVTIGLIVTVLDVSLLFMMF